MTIRAGRVSVVVPVYRVEPYIAECVDSIASQDHRPHELILVDDRGGDGSIAIGIDTASRSGLGARVVEMPENSGIGAARNAGLRAATGDIVWFCDADDTADPRMLGTLVGRMQADKTQLAVARTLVVGGPSPYVVEPWAIDGVVPGRRVAEAMLRNELRGYAPCRLIAATLARAHRFSEGVAYEDLDVSVGLALAAGRVTVCSAPLYRYRIGHTSHSAHFSPRTFDLLAQEQRVLATIGDPPRVSQRTVLQYRYEGVTLPLANMAARAGTADPQALRALRVASSRVRMTDVVRLVRRTTWRLAVAASVLRVSTRVYASILRRR